MLRADSRASNNSLRLWLFIDDLARGLDLAAEPGIADGLFGHEVHATLEEPFQRVCKIQVALGVAAGGVE